MSFSQLPRTILEMMLKMKVRILGKKCPYPALNAISHCEGVPQTFEKIKGRDDESEWSKAVDEELASLVTNEPWDLVDIPKGQKIVKSKWILSRKMQIAKLTVIKLR